MPRQNIIEHSPYSAKQLYDLVIDVARYPEFLPWCKSARILAQYDGYFEAELMISFKHVRESYVSKVTGSKADMSIKVEMIRGPFHHLVNEWRFECLGNKCESDADDAGGNVKGDEVLVGARQNEAGCNIHFHIDFAFKNIFLEKIIGVLFGKATQKMVGAFKARAESLYG